MDRRVTIRNAALLAGLLLVFCAGAVYAATYEQGYATGCDIAQGVYSHPNDCGLRDRTIDAAWAAGEFEYALGVLYGYDACDTSACPVPDEPDDPGPDYDPNPDPDIGPDPGRGIG